MINAGTRTRNAFAAGLGTIPYEHYSSKCISLHIDAAGGIHFIYKDTPVDFSDSYVFTRLRATDPHFCGMLYAYFAHHNIPASDPINCSFPYSAEKIAQMMFLALNAVRIPETIIFREESYAANRAYIEAHSTFPLVYKTDGSQGKNVHIANSLAELDVLVAEKKPHRLALIQPFIENSFDTRTIVVYGEILGSIKRTRTSGHLNNIAQGAVPSHFELSEHEKDVVRNAALACGIDVGGVDLIHTDRGPIVLEVNKGPQISGFESVHNFKVFTKVSEIMRKKFGG